MEETSKGFDGHMTEIETCQQIVVPITKETLINKNLSMYFYEGEPSRSK